MNRTGKTSVTPEELQKKEEELKAAANKYDDLVFAVGSAYEGNITDIRRALHNADERMYADKKRYYEMNPDKKRGADERST